MEQAIPFFVMIQLCFHGGGCFTSHYDMHRNKNTDPIVACANIREQLNDQVMAMKDRPFYIKSVKCQDMKD